MMMRSSQFFYSRENVRTGIFIGSGGDQIPYGCIQYFGGKSGSYYFDVDYTDIFFEEDAMVIYNESECQIFTTEGVEKYRGNFGKSVRLMLPAGGSYKYYLVTDNTIDTIQLK